MYFTTICCRLKIGKILAARFNYFSSTSTHKHIKLPTIIMVKLKSYFKKKEGLLFFIKINIIQMSLLAIDPCRKRLLLAVQWTQRLEPISFIVPIWFCNYICNTDADTVSVIQIQLQINSQQYKNNSNPVKKVLQK